MQAHQAIVADSSTLLGHFGDYEIYPLQACSEDQIADLFTKVSQRGNPLLQKRPREDLLLLGRAFYRKCLPLGMSHVALHKGVPVAMNTMWDVAEGGVWKDSGLPIPVSMEAHREVGQACLARMDPNDKSRVLFAAFGGVDPQHSGKLGGFMLRIGFITAMNLGFKKSFIFSVLDKKGFLGRVRGHKAVQTTDVYKHMKPLFFADIVAENEAITAELKEIDGVAKAAVGHLAFLTSDYYLSAIAAGVGATPEELKEGSKPIAARQLEVLKERTAVPISRL